MQPNAQSKPHALNRRKRHLLFAAIALERMRTTECLPTSRSVALAACVHPATARRWLADLRAVMGKPARLFREGLIE